MYVCTYALLITYILMQHISKYTCTAFYVYMCVYFKGMAVVFLVTCNVVNVTLPKLCLSKSNTF